ncbi:MAG: TetR/AcrR family transcriptional regulator [Firmicutes bacterium]|nr:TetR/AcrR family transcriptional regulator [Bacillota bacterium]
MPRPSNPDLIKKIKRIVAEEVKKKGTDGLSVRHIAKAAGVTPATIYYYFENKEDLLNAIKLSAVKEMDEYILSRVRPEAPLIKQVEDLIRAFIDWALKYPQLMDLVFSTLPPKIDLDDAAIKDYYHSQFRAIELMEKILAEKAGLAKACDPKVDCSVYFGMIYGTVKLHLEKRTLPEFWTDPAPIFERLVEMIVGALSK